VDILDDASKTLLDEILYQTMQDIPSNLQLVMDPPQDGPDIGRAYDMQSPGDFIMGVAWGEAYYSFILMFTSIQGRQPTMEEAEEAMRVILNKAPEISRMISENIR
jgi:hypothetical protein